MMSKDLLLEFVFTFECFHLVLDLFADECFPKQETRGHDDGSWSRAGKSVFG